jgi:membrane-associated phospholipid phosphatase
MRLIFQQQKWFYIPYVFIIMVCLFFVVQFSRADIHLWLNRFHSQFFDIFFKYITELGNGICLIFLLIIMCFTKFRYGLLLVVVFLVSGLVVQLLKHFVFYDIARPLMMFQTFTSFHWVEGVKRLCCHSFPSGHSATAFGFYSCFAMISKKKWIKIAMFVLACLVAYSRVYLSQHFLIDIMAGSLIGTITAIACYTWIGALKYYWLDKNFKIIIP